MIRRLAFTRRAAGVGYEDFQAHWRGKHAELARLLPNLRSYVQDHAILGAGGPLLPYTGFDTCVELEYDSRDEMQASLSSPEYRTSAVADQVGFVDMSHLTSMLVDVHRASASPPPDAVKLMTFIRRSGAVERERFDAAVLGPYAEAIDAAAPGPRELLLPTADVREGDPPPAFDAVDVVWLPDAAAAVAFAGCEAAQRARWELGGLASGTERLVARAVRVI